MQLTRRRCVSPIIQSSREGVNKNSAGERDGSLSEFGRPVSMSRRALQLYAIELRVPGALQLDSASKGFAVAIGTCEDILSFAVESARILATRRRRTTQADSINATLPSNHLSML